MMKALKELSRILRVSFNRNFAFRRLKEYHARPWSLEETIDWAMNFGGGHMTIKTLQIPSEITRLARAVTAFKPKIIHEIGTARGGTSLIWASIASEEMITCDLEHRPAQKPLLEAWCRLVRSAK